MRLIHRCAVAAVALASCALSARVSAQQADGVAQLLRRLEAVVKGADVDAFVASTAETERARLRDFIVGELAAPVSRVVIQERDREQLRGVLPGDGYRLMLDLFGENGDRARVATWRLDVRRIGDSGTDRDWTIVDGERLSSVENLYRLALNTTKQFTARDLKLSAEDLDLTLTEGSVFISEVDTGVTGLVLLGRGTMNFHPEPQTEKGQVKIFTGAETLESAFDTAFVRINPSDFEQLLTSSQLQPKSAGVDARELKRAHDVFREESTKSFVIDLGDLSRDPWSLLPGPTDFLAEVHTRRYDTITYARSASEAEDITLFDRKHHRNIALYASKQKLASRGRFYNEDDLVDYDVIDYDVDVAALPDRQWIEGRTRIYLKTRAYILNTITLKLADPLVVQSIVSNEFGRLFGIRVKNQNTVVVNLPSAVLKDTTITLNISYAGRLEAQAPEREALTLDSGDQQQRQPDVDMPLISAEPSYLYSSRSFWYPQAVVTDYATARIRLSVPPTYEAVASGELEPGFPTLLPGKDPTQTRKQYAYVASQPLRYLAFVVSRFMRAETVTIGFPEVPKDKTENVQMPGLSYRSLNLSVEANPRQTSRGHDLAERAAEIATFYQSIIGDSPYSSFTIALVESDRPGGHSPAYFAALNQPLPTTQLVWRNDPAAFSNFPEFFLAHEIAHQWWGQAIGWRNYHEQWISEGFAQYFAALYAQHQRGDDAFASVIRQLRRWGIEQSEQGPVSLGYRLGHIRGESRVFRALVYNKSAAVLHMLRRLVGDDVFFSGVRRFYRTMRFKKAGTEDFRAAMEAAYGRSLERFFERWIYNATLPRLTFNHRIEGSDLVLHFEQVGELFDVPVSVVLNYGDRKSTIVVPVTDRVVDKRVRLEGTLRGVDISKDDGTLAEINKTS